MAAPRTVILVPVGSAIDPGCEDALRELERRGDLVRRVRGYSAIDAARNQLATDALADGFDELLWVDTDIVFRPDDVDALRAHGRPFVCGLYPKKGPRQFACAFLPGTAGRHLRQAGGLIPVLYCGFGFVFTRREVFDAVRVCHDLPTLNRRFERPLVPYFAPLWAGERGRRPRTCPRTTPSASGPGGRGSRSSPTPASGSGTSARTGTAGRTPAATRFGTGPTPSTCRRRGS